MEYSKSISNNRKDLKLTTDANVCKVNNYSFGDFLVGEDYRQKLLNKIKKRVEDSEKLLQLQIRLLEQIEHDRSIRLYGSPFIEDREKLLQLQRLLEQIEHDRNIRSYGSPFIEDGKSKRK